MFADLTDVRCYYELVGAGDPIVLIPGLGGTASLWDCVAPELSDTFCLVLFDNRGIGRSIPKRSPHSLSDYAVDVVELLDHLQLDRAHVIGLSLGGIIAQQLAVDHPGRVDRLVLVSCSNRFGPYLREIAKLLGQAMRYFPRSVYRRTMELLGTAPEYFDEHLIEINQKIARGRELDPPRSAVVRQLRCLARSESVREDGYCITAPTLVVAGEQDMLIPACYARRMAREIPGSEFLLVKSCGHNPFVERSEIVVPRITDFLMRRKTVANGKRPQLAGQESV